MEVAIDMLNRAAGPRIAALRPLRYPQDLPAAQALLMAALSWDHTFPVAQEKLFGKNGQRSAHTLGAFAGDELVGLVAQAGRWVKLLAVHPQARRRGIGTMLLLAAQTWLEGQPRDDGPRPKLRIGDHPGNYLSPGIDEREEAGQAFLRARHFVEIGRNLNLRAPVRNNPLLRPAHIESRIKRVEKKGYVVRRATAVDVPPLLEMVTAQFHRVWAYELSRALGKNLGGEAAEHTPALPEGEAVHIALAADGTPVAFAAHDGNNRGLGWFGPTGTLPSHRGLGIGEALLLCCLRDVRGEVMGAVIDDQRTTAHPRHDAGVIAWVGPVEYYARACGAVADRRFVVYEEAA